MAGSGLAEGASTGIDIVGDVSISARATGSSNRSDFAVSFGVNADHGVLRTCVDFATGESIGMAALIAIAVPKPAKQKAASHNILVILNPKTPAAHERMGADTRDQIWAERLPESEPAEIGRGLRVAHLLPADRFGIAFLSASQIN
jgi:hypothetical protein